MASTAATWSPPQVASRTYRSREIVRASSTPRSRERYRRYEPQVAQGLTEMFVAGTSTHKVGDVAQTLMGVAPSASAISRLNGDLEQQFAIWRERRLQEHWRILYAGR